MAPRLGVLKELLAQRGVPYRLGMEERIQVPAFKFIPHIAILDPMGKQLFAFDGKAIMRAHAQGRLVEAVLEKVAELKPAAPAGPEAVPPEGSGP